MEAEEVELVTFSVIGEDGCEASDVDSQSDLILDPETVNKKERFSVKVKSLLKLKTSNDAVEANENQNRLKRELSYFSGVAYLIGGIIGSGIFITPSTILCRTGSFGLSMIVWVIGGMVSMAGAFCYTELGLLIRKSGGDYSYIKEIYSFKKSNRVVEVVGSLLSFLFVWGSVCVIRSSSLAIITLTCAQYLIKPFFIDCENVPTSAVKLLSITILST